MIMECAAVRAFTYPMNPMSDYVANGAEYVGSGAEYVGMGAEMLVTKR